MLFYCCATAKVQMASFECHFCSFFVFLPKHFLPKVSAVYCCIMWWIFFFFGRAYCVWDAWSTLDCECFLWGCGELDRGQTSHFTSSSIVLQTVLRAWRNDNQRRHSLPFSFLPFLFFFPFYSLSLPVIQSYSFFLFFYPVTLFLSPNHLPFWPVFAISSLSPSVSPVRGHSL